MSERGQRFTALDVFRGMTICFMIIVNTPGSGAAPYAPLEHAAWHGFTPTDLVFPSFLFAVGNAMSFSLGRYEQLGNGAFLKKVLKRTALIFLIGYLMYWFPFFRINETGHVVGAPIGTTRIMGVLQRIALAYCFASVFIHYLSTRAVMVVSALLLAGYWVLLLVFGDPAQPFSMLGNAGIYLDRSLMGIKHMYHGEGVAFDPEGWLSTMTAIVNVVAGYYAGRFMQQKGKGYETIARLVLTGALFIFIALCWNMVFPINKKLWSSPFVLLTTGIDLILISALVYIIELRQANPLNWTRFFLVPGMNPLFIYVLSEILVVVLYMVHTSPHQNLYGAINANVFQAIAPGPFGSFLFALCYMLLCWSIGYILYRKKIYVKV